MAFKNIWMGLNIMLYLSENLEERSDKKKIKRDRDKFFRIFNIFLRRFGSINENISSFPIGLYFILSMEKKTLEK